MIDRLVITAITLQLTLWNFPLYACDAVVIPDYKFTKGDSICISLTGIPKERMINEQLDEDGYIRLPFIGKIEGHLKTLRELELIIRSTYIQSNVYKSVDVTVAIPKTRTLRKSLIPGRIPGLDHKQNNQGDFPIPKNTASEAIVEKRERKNPPEQDSVLK